MNELVNKLEPIARESGDEALLAVLRPADKMETGADRQRRLYREGGNWQALVADMIGRFAQELDADEQVAHGRG